MKTFYSINSLFWLVVITVFIWLVVFPMFQLGMFTDGMLYASISRNFYLGQGSWWNIYSHEPTKIFFHEQPPLVFWLQSFFFQIIGDSVYTERVYSLVLILLNGVIILFFWKELNNESKTAWIPILLWLSIYSVRFSAINNLIENTLQFFDLCSVYFLLKAIKGGKWFIKFPLGFGFLFLASLSKGFQGLFPIATPFCYWLAFRNFPLKKLLLFSFFLVFGIFGIYYLLFQSPEIHESYKAYFASRFPGFPFTPHTNTNNRLYLFSQLIIELIPPIIICGVIFLVSNKNFIHFKIESKYLSERKLLLFFFLVGFTASIPLMISYEQRFFYLTTSMPFFVLGLSIVIKNYVIQIDSILRNKLSFLKRLNATLFILICIGIIATLLFAGRVTRDKELLSDVFVIGEKVKGEDLIDISNSGWNNWTSHTYFRRYFNIELVSGACGHKYFLVPKNENPQNSYSFKKVEWNTTYYNVYTTN